MFIVYFLKETLLVAPRPPGLARGGVWGFFFFFFFFVGGGGGGRDERHILH